MSSAQETTGKRKSTKKPVKPNKLRFTKRAVSAKIKSGGIALVSEALVKKGVTNLVPKMHVKRGDLVMMISGSEKAGKGKIGKVLKVFPAQGKIIVEGINVIKRATKARPGSMQTQGGIVEKEAPIFACKVQLYDPVAKKPTRIRHKVLENGKKVRVGVKSGEILDN